MKRFIRTIWPLWFLTAYRAFHAPVHLICITPTNGIRFRTATFQLNRSIIQPACELNMRSCPVTSAPATRRPTITSPTAADHNHLRKLFRSASSAAKRRGVALVPNAVPPRRVVLALQRQALHQLPSGTS